jgi:hypothetical protein
MWSIVALAPEPRRWNKRCRIENLTVLALGVGDTSGGG